MFLVVFLLPLVLGITTMTHAPTRSSNDSLFITVDFTRSPSGYYYDVPFKFGTNSAGNNDDDGIGPDNDILLRLDLMQPEIWVMNSNAYYNCSYIASWWASEASMYGDSTSLPELITTASEYLAQECADGGAFITDHPRPTATISGITNGDPYTLPYINMIDASGEWETDNLSFNITNDTALTFENFTFVDVNSTVLFYGGLGVAGTPQGSGFLYLLRNLGYIKSPGYSLWINNNTAKLFPGIVNKDYFTGPLYSFPMSPHQGYRYANGDPGNAVVGNLVIPSIELDSVDVINEETGQSVTLNDSPLAVLFDSRTTYNFLPLDLIVNLAIQTNAYFLNEADRWIVQCEQIQDSNASISFSFGDFELKVPLSTFIEPADYNDKILKYNNGQQACYLSFLPTNDNGVSTLGLRVLSELFLAVDNEGENIALALANKNMNDPASSSVSLDTNSTKTTNGSSVLLSISYIQKGSIPFATSVNASSQAVLSYSEVSGSNTGYVDVPARFTASVISGEFFVTGSGKSIAASAAGEPRTSKNIGSGISNPLRYDGNSLHGKLSLVGITVGVLLASIFAL